MAETDTVLIACKHPAGLVLNLDQYVITHQPTNTIQRKPGKQTVTLRGWSMPADPKGLRAREAAYRRLGVTQEGGYALTPVPVDFWTAWIKKNADSPLVKDKIILGPHADAIGQAADNEAVEPMFRPMAEDGKDTRAPGVQIDRDMAA